MLKNKLIILSIIFMFVSGFSGCDGTNNQKHQGFFGGVLGGIGEIVHSIWSSSVNAVFKQDNRKKNTTEISDVVTNTTSITTEAANIVTYNGIDEIKVYMMTIVSVGVIIFLIYFSFRKSKKEREKEILRLMKIIELTQNKEAKKIVTRLRSKDKKFNKTILNLMPQVDFKKSFI